MLAERGGFDRQRIKVLSGDQATRANFDEAVTKWLASATVPGDTVFISFSGYAGEFPKAAGGDGTPGSELFLVPHDNALGAAPQSQDQVEAMLRERMIFETTWLRWLQELPGRKIVLVLDLYRSPSPDQGSTNPVASRPGTSQLVPGGTTDLTGLPDTERAVVQTWSMPQAAYFTEGAQSTSWTRTGSPTP